MDVQKYRLNLSFVNLYREIELSSDAAATSALRGTVSSVILKSRWFPAKTANGISCVATAAISARTMFSNCIV